MFQHEFLGEGLASLEPGRRLVRSEDLEPPATKKIRYSVAERNFRSGDRQIHPLFLCEIRKFCEIRRINVRAFRDFRDPGIARNTEYLLDGKALL